MGKAFSLSLTGFADWLRGRESDRPADPAPESPVVFSPIVYLPLPGESLAQRDARVAAAQATPGFATVEESLVTGLELDAIRVSFRESQNGAETNWIIGGRGHTVSNPQSDPASPTDWLATATNVLRQLAPRGELRMSLFDRVVTGRWAAADREVEVTWDLGPVEAVSLWELPERLFSHLQSLALGKERAPSFLLFSAPAELCHDEHRFWFDMLVFLGKSGRKVTLIANAARETLWEEARELAGLNVQTFNGAIGETPDHVLTRVFRSSPDVLAVTELPNAETVRMLCNAALGQPKRRGKLVLGWVPAHDAIEAVVRVLLLNSPREEVARALAGVLNVQTTRRACVQCSGPTRLECRSCLGSGFRGRQVIAELLLPDNSLRQAIAQEPRLELLRQIAARG